MWGVRVCGCGGGCEGYKQMWNFLTQEFDSKDS